MTLRYVRYTQINDGEGGAICANVIEEGLLPKNVICVCIDEIKRGTDRRTDVPLLFGNPCAFFFTNQLQLLAEMEALYDRLNFPQPSTRDRTLKPKKVQNRNRQRRQKVKDEQDIKKSGGTQGFLYCPSVTSRPKRYMAGIHILDGERCYKAFPQCTGAIKAIDSAIEGSELKDGTENKGTL